MALGRPRLGFLVSSGAMDSMVSNYTANNKPRSSDAYAHGGEKGHRPDRALITYVSKIRQAYRGAEGRRADGRRQGVRGEGRRGKDNLNRQGHLYSRIRYRDNRNHAVKGRHEVL